VSGPAVLLLFGERFRPMIPVLTAAALLAIPKALANSPTQLLQATQNQGFLVAWGCICGGIDVMLDILLTPRYGALGAAIANGAAQTLAAAGIWWRAWRLFSLDLRMGAFLKIALAGAGMTAAAATVSRAIPTYAGMALAIVAGALAWFVLLRAIGALNSTDMDRLRSVGRGLPGWVTRFLPGR
jgi:O-antigen/teichoic acid export membrane protein